jgi:hypothetical protein
MAGITVTLFIFRLPPATAIFGTLFFVLLSTGLIAFSEMAKRADQPRTWPVRILYCVIVGVLGSSFVLLFTWGFFGVPTALNRFLSPPTDTEKAWHTLLEHYAQKPQERARLQAIRDGLPEPRDKDDKIRALEAFYDDIDRRDYKTAYARIHPARHSEIGQRMKGWGIDTFKARYSTTTGHDNLVITPIDADVTKPRYLVSLDVRDEVSRNELYHAKNSSTAQMYAKGIVDQPKLLAFVRGNLEKQFIFPADDKWVDKALDDLIAKNRFSFLFSPVFVEEIANDLGLVRREGPGLRDTVTRHFIYRLILIRDGPDWKIRSGLDKPLIAE